MTSARFGRGQKALALVPLAVLSAAWTASIAGVGASTASADPATPQTHLPDGSTVPTQAIKAPASVSVAGGVAPAVHGDVEKVVASSSTSGIPAAALAAYQRAETVIDAADKSCHLSWQLIAAIGRVESDHGRTNGNTLDAKGIARPGIFGPALDGKHGTSRIVDTDAGQYDADDRFDRAIGPMQFIPSTWSVVGVDADGDGQRNPQDINDAALATAVYLCSGDDDLSTPAGQRAAVYRYNHSQSYVDLVLSIMNAYQQGEFTSVPNGTTSAGYLVPAPPKPSPKGPKKHHHQPSHAHTQQAAPARRPLRRRASNPRGADDARRRRLHRRWRWWRRHAAAAGAHPERQRPAAAVDVGHAGRPGAHLRPGGREVHGRGLHRQPAQGRRPVRQVRVQVHALGLTGGCRFPRLTGETCTGTARFSERAAARPRPPST